MLATCDKQSQLKRAKLSSFGSSDAKAEKIREACPSSDGDLADAAKHPRSSLKCTSLAKGGASEGVGLAVEQPVDDESEEKRVYR